MTKVIAFFVLLTSVFNSVFSQTWTEEYFKAGVPDAKKFLDTVKYAARQSIGTPAPQLKFVNIESGSADSLRSYLGSVLLVSLWQTGCVPCVKELPDLEQIRKAYADQGLVLLCISPENKERQFKFFSEKTISVSGLKAMMPFASYLKPFQYMANPAGFIVDRTGIIRDAWIGPQTFDSLKEKIKPYLVPRQ